MNVTNHIFVDIDDTLTEGTRDRPIRRRIEALNRLAAEGKKIILWSGGGDEKATKKFAEENGIRASACICKPDFCIDDAPGLRPRWIVHPPSWLDSK